MESQQATHDAHAAGGKSGERRRGGAAALLLRVASVAAFATLYVVPGVAAARAATASTSTSALSRWESPAAMSDAAERFVREHLPAGAAADHVRVRAGRIAARFPACAAQHLVALPFGNPSPYGAQTVQLRCEAPQVWSVYLQVSVDWPQQVVVAAHAISPGHTLEPSDLQVLERDRAGLPPGALQSE